MSMVCSNGTEVKEILHQMIAFHNFLESFLFFFNHEIFCAINCVVGLANGLKKLGKYYGN